MNILVNLINQIPSALLIGALAWLAKILVTHRLKVDTANFQKRLNDDTEAFKKELNKDTEAFKNELRIKADKEIALYKSKLSSEQLQFQISYSGIFGKQANALIEFYQFAIEFYSVMSDSLKLDFKDLSDDKCDDITKKMTAIHKIWESFSECYKRNRIFLSNELEVRFKKLSASYEEKYHRYIHCLTVQSLRDLDRKDIKELSENTDDLKKSIQKEIPELIDEIVNIMRYSFGIKNLKRTGGAFEQELTVKDTHSVR